MIGLRNAALSLWLTGWCLVGWVAAITPEHPDVKKVVDKAVAYLEKHQSGGHVGDRILLGLTLLKARNAEHPLVKSVLDEITATSFDTDQLEMYAHGLGVILVGEANRSTDGAALQRLTDALIARQKPFGGFGYDGKGPHRQIRDTGDISQTQYAVLAMWTARQAGAQVPQAAVQKVCEYLLRCQDPNGGWGYQGKEGEPRNRALQSGVTHSLTAGGLGSVCVCADLLGMHHQAVAEAVENGNVPAALKVVKKADPEKEKAAQGNGTVSFELVNDSINDGTSWFAKNYRIDPAAWKFYYMYGLERCESFRELYLRKFRKEPPWYNDGFEYLSKTQSPEGTWEGDYGTAASTCFSVLFLLRSARKSIAKARKDLGDGVLTSGYGLPTNLANAQVKQGKLVDSPFAGEVNDLMSMLDDPENPELLRLAEERAVVKLDQNLTKRQGQITKLREKVSQGNWESRMIAVRTLGRARDLDSVPVLLYAFTDPDPQVVKEADAALRFISRKFKGVGYEGEEDRKSITTARNVWRDWFLSVRPDAELLD
jgi:hypothetical protein